MIRRWVPSDPSTSKTTLRRLTFAATQCIPKMRFTCMLAKTCHSVKSSTLVAGWHWGAKAATATLNRLLTNESTTLHRMTRPTNGSRLCFPAREVRTPWCKSMKIRSTARQIPLCLDFQPQTGKFSRPVLTNKWWHPRCPSSSVKVKQGLQSTFKM
jgi:hypothetical protein